MIRFRYRMAEKQKMFSRFPRGCVRIFRGYFLGAGWKRGRLVMAEVDFFFENGMLTLGNYLDFLLRIVMAMVCGGLVGLEREKRLKNAGLRTHIIVAIASCLMMVVSKYGFMDVVGIEGLRLSADASRIAHGVVSAIGFLGAGVIFVRRESVVGLTTAAGLWATVGIGITIGAGMYSVGLFTTLMILLIQWALHGKHAKSHSQNSGSITSNITKHGITVEELSNYLDKYEVSLREMSLCKDEDGCLIAKAEVLFRPDDSILDLMKAFEDSKYVDSVEVYPTL